MNSGTAVLKQALEKVWRNRSEDTVRRPCPSVMRPMEIVVEANGGHSYRVME